MFGSLDNKQIEDVLMHQVLGRIGCCDNGVTYIVPISYAYDGTCVYGHTREGMKINIMRKNTAVCFEVEEMKDMANWKSVIAWGDYEELPEGDARVNAIQTLLSRQLPIISSITTHLGATWPFTSEGSTELDGIVFRRGFSGRVAAL